MNLLIFSIQILFCLTSAKTTIKTGKLTSLIGKPENKQNSGCGYSRNNYDLSLKAGSKVLAVRRFVTEYQCKIDCDETQACRGYQYEKKSGKVVGSACTHYTLIGRWNKFNKVDGPMKFIQEKGSCHKCKYLPRSYKTIEIIKSPSDKKKHVNYIKMLTEVKSTDDCIHECNSLSYCYGFTYEPHAKQCELLKNNGSIVYSSEETEDCQCAVFYEKRSCEPEDPRPKVGLDYSSGCTNVCADTKSNDFKCQLNNMAYTLFDNYTDTCLEDGMRKGLPCFKMILSAENITSKIEVSINPCIPAERFLIYKPVSDPTKYSTCKNVGKATAFTGGCKYLCETGKYKSVAIDILDSSLKTGPPVTKKYCEIKVEIDGKPVKLQPVGDFLKGICKA